MYSWVSNYPQKLTALNSKLLLPYTFYGSGLLVQLSWVLQLRVSPRTTISFGQGCGHLKAPVREDPLLISLMWLLVRDISSLIYEFTPKNNLEHGSSLSSEPASNRMRQSAQDRSCYLFVVSDNCFSFINLKNHNCNLMLEMISIILAIFYSLEEIQSIFDRRPL